MQRPTTRRRLMTVTAGFMVGLAGCSSDSESDEPGSEDTTSEESEPSDSETDTESNSDSGDSTSDESESSTGNTGTEQENWDDHQKIERYKSAPAGDWIEIRFGDLDIPDYDSAEELELYEQEDVISGRSEDDYSIEVDLSETGLTELRHYVATAIIGDNRDDTVSVLLSYQEPYDDLGSVEELDNMAWISGIPVIPSELSNLDYSAEDLGAYPVENLGQNHLFTEEAITTFFRDYVTGVRDVGNNFPEDLLSHAEEQTQRVGSLKKEHTGNDKEEMPKLSEDYIIQMEECDSSTIEKSITAEHTPAVHQGNLH